MMGHSFSLRNLVVLNYAGLYGWRRANRKNTALCEFTIDTDADYVRGVVATNNLKLFTPAEWFSEEVKLEFEGKNMQLRKNTTSIFRLYMKNMDVEFVKTLKIIINRFDG